MCFSWFQFFHILVNTCFLFLFVCFLIVTRCEVTCRLTLKCIFHLNWYGYLGTSCLLVNFDFSTSWDHSLNTCYFDIGEDVSILAVDLRSQRIYNIKIGSPGVAFTWEILHRVFPSQLFWPWGYIYWMNTNIFIRIISTLLRLSSSNYFLETTILS